MRSVKKKLAAIRMEIDSPHPNITQRTVRSLLDYVADLERQRDAAHAVAIQAALRIFREQYQAAMMDTGGDREAATYCGLQAIEKLRTDRA